MDTIGDALAPDTASPPGLRAMAGAEALGTGFLVMAVVGSGIAAERAFPTDPGLVLLVNALVTGGALLLIVAATSRSGDALRVGHAVGAYIAVAVWFTSSTAIANPAVTLARIGTDTFTGITAASAVVFLAVQALALPIAHLSIRLVTRSTP